MRKRYFMAGHAEPVYRFVRFGRFLGVIGLALVVSLLGMGTANAATRFVSGYRDGIWVYGVIEKNGVQYRTDQLGVKMNQGLWAELSSEDKMKLAKTYSYMTHRLAGDFGADGQEAVNAFVNDQTGWTALVDAMKAKHAGKDFPELAEAFGDDVILELPQVYAACWEVVNSDPYREAARLKQEIEADFGVGREVYKMLVNANWDQVAIAVKGLSGPLIKVIVSNFITPFVTHGAAPVSDLLATADDFAKDLSEFIEQKTTDGQKPPDPAELIAKLDQYIKDMEDTAHTAKQRVADKKARLQTLADAIRKSDEECLAARKEAASQTRDRLQETIGTLPNPDNLQISPDPVPDGVPPDQEEAWIFTNMHDKCWAKWNEVMREGETLSETISQEKTSIADQFNAVTVPGLGDAFGVCYEGLTSGFDGRYRRVNVPAAMFETWAFEPVADAYSQAQSTYTQAGEDAQNLITSALSRIDPIHARALGMDAYANYLGARDAEGNITPLYPLPSVTFSATGIRNFDDMINIISTPDQELTKAVTDLEERKAILEDASDNLPDGVEQRKDWVREQYRVYEDLIFNFENSLSFVIAALRQIDRLHSDPYFIRSDYPYVIYDDVELYTYRFNTDGVLADIEAAGPDPVAKEKARLAALRRLLSLHSEEQALVQKLMIAQQHHEADHQALSNFYDALFAQYRNTGLGAIFVDVEEIVGKPMKSLYDAWHDLVPDITYYFLVGADDFRWIRKPNELSTGLFGKDIYGNPNAYGRVSGRTDTFYEMYDLYNYMADEKAAIMAMTLEAFNAWMTQTTKARDAFHDRLTMEGVFAPGWPAWQLAFAFDNRREAINSEYRGYGVVTPMFWRVEGDIEFFGASGIRGEVPAAGVGIPDIDILIDGYYGEDGTGAHVTFPAVTGPDGHFVFEWVGTGNFTILPANPDAGFTFDPTPVQVRGKDVMVTVPALPNTDAGNLIAGFVENPEGKGLGGMTVTLASLDDGAMTSMLTLDNGSFLFSGLPAGDYKVYPLETGLEAVPGFVTLTLPPSPGTLRFVMNTEPVMVPGDVNGDNLADIKDLILVLQVSAGKSPALADLNGDVNNDKKINMIEAMYVMRHIASETL